MSGDKDLTSLNGKHILTLKVITLNIWGLPGPLTPHKKERIVAIADALNRDSYDIVCLQEVWSLADYKHIKKNICKSLPFAHYFHSGVLGSGLAIFSKWNMLSTFFHQWPLNGYFHMVHHADWFGGKGVALAQLDVKGIPINVYNVHLHAQYHENDMYLAHRVVQSFDTGLFFKLTSSEAVLSLFCGDLNTKPGETCYRLIVDIGSLTDSYDCPTGESRDWGTNCSTRISFSPQDLTVTCPRGQRLDYILYKSGDGYSSAAKRHYFPLEPRIPGQEFSYSDHEAVAADIVLFRTDDVDAPDLFRKGTQVEDIRGTIEKALIICNSALNSVHWNTQLYWIWTFVVITVLTIIHMGVSELHILKSILWVICIILVVYFVFMATVWHRLETRGILGAKKRMKTILSKA